MIIKPALALLAAAAAVVVVVMICSHPAAAAAARAAERPNIIVILADDMGWGDIGCYPKGAAWGEAAHIPTPNIDAIAAGGAQCMQGYATGMVCSPSRAGLMSGQFQSRWGFYGFEETTAPIPRDIKLMPEVLREAGYATGMVGKWHISTDENSIPLKRGFDRFFGFLAGQHDYYYSSLGQTFHGVGWAPDGHVYDQDQPSTGTKYLTEEFTDRAIEFMSGARRENKPFFLYLPYNTPHSPHQVPWVDLAPYMKGKADQRPTPRDLVRAMIVNLDRNVGRLTAWLGENGLQENTIVVFSSDNGGSDGGPGQKLAQHNGGLRGRKGTFYEGGVRVPYIVRWPEKIPAGLTYDKPVSHVDFFATAIAAAGIAPPPNLQGLDGVDLVPYLRGERRDEPPHTKIFWTMQGPTPSHWAVRDGDLKLIYEDIRPETMSDKRGRVLEKKLQLYDLSSDPTESKDLIAERPDDAKRLQSIFDAYEASCRPSLFTPEVEQRHRAALAARANDPRLADLRTAAGSPGHWIGEAGKDRANEEGVFPPLPTTAPAPAADKRAAERAARSAANRARYDVVVYGGTSTGVAAAVQAARGGRSVVLIEPSGHLGGMTSSGLGNTDYGRKETIGGVSREFYQRVKRHYSNDAAWTRQERDDYAFFATDPDTMWRFEPHVAENIFDDMTREAGVTVIRGQRLDLKRGVKKSATRIDAITMESGESYAGTIFIDATYEGDLMARAGVSYVVGREANSVYGEQFNGVQNHMGDSYNFYVPVSAYRVIDDPTSGLLPGVQPPPGADGTGDHRIMAYNFRLCTTDDPPNMRPWTKPANYDEKDFEMLLRAYDRGYVGIPWHGAPMPNKKFDANSGGFIGSDWFGMNYAFPDGDYATREKYIADHKYYMLGMAWTIRSNPRVPESAKAGLMKRGLTKDEFVANDGWPWIPYIREARRMVSDYVMTEHDALWQRRAPDSIGLANYGLDSHHVQRHVDAHGNIRNEGNVLVPISGPYPVSYRAITPKADECTNLLVPTCLAASHITYGSIRMEPVYMVLGQSAGEAAAMAVEQDVAVQDVKYDDLRRRLLALGQILDYEGRSARADAVGAKDLEGTVLDDREAKIVGYWGRAVSGKFVLPYVLVGDGKRKMRTWQDGAARMIPMTITYETTLPDAGEYEVRMSYLPAADRASNVAVFVDSAGGRQERRINQQQPPAIDGMFVSLGTFSFEADKPARVVVSTEGTDGDVCADAIQFLKR